MEAPKSLTGATFVLVRDLQKSVDDGFKGVRADLANKADKADIARIDGVLTRHGDDIDELKKARDERRAVTRFHLNIWRAAASVGAMTAAGAVVYGVVH